MKSVQKCPICGGNLITKEVEKLLRGGNNTASIKVMADVCSHCGERLYQKETVERFEQIRLKLEREDTHGFKPIGKSYLIST